MAVGLLGLLLGVGLGLLAGWVVWPAEFDIVTPELLATHYRTDYANMIAAHYAHAADLDLARRQLARLGPASTAILRRAAATDPAAARLLANLEDESGPSTNATAQPALTPPAD